MNDLSRIVYCDCVKCTWQNDGMCGKNDIHVVPIGFDDDAICDDYEEEDDDGW